MLARELIRTIPLKSLFLKLINIIYPPRCPICQKFLNNGISFCQDCSSKFQKITSPFCTICGTPFISDVEEDHVCENCLRKRPSYEVARAPYLYEGVLMTAIHKFKYGAKSFLANSLGLLLAEFAESWVKESENLLTIPVPLHPKRLRERGFNQSLLLARHVTIQLDTELDFLSLRRVRYTSPQTGLKKEERLKNVRGAFQLVNPKTVKKKNILLVDDVATTGNTLNECARVLKRSGCKKVLCLVLARTGRF